MDRDLGQDQALEIKCAEDVAGKVGQGMQAEVREGAGMQHHLQPRKWKVPRQEV